MKFLLLPLMLLSAITFAQEKPVKLVEFPYNEAHKIKYEIIENSDLNKQALYKNAQTWIAIQFGNYKSVVQFEDKEAGRIICKGSLLAESALETTLSFTLSVDVKDKKYRVAIDDIIYSSRSSVSSHILTLEDEITRNVQRTDEYKDAGLQILNSYDQKLRDVLASLKKRINVNDDF